MTDSRLRETRSLLFEADEIGGVVVIINWVYRTRSSGISPSEQQTDGSQFNYNSYSLCSGSFAPSSTSQIRSTVPLISRDSPSNLKFAPPSCQPQKRHISSLHQRIKSNNIQLTFTTDIVSRCRRPSITQTCQHPQYVWQISA